MTARDGTVTGVSGATATVQLADGSLRHVPIPAGATIRHGDGVAVVDPAHPSGVVYLFGSADPAPTR